MTEFIPPELFEMLNWARATVSLIIVVFAAFYQASEYRLMRAEMLLTRAEALSNLRKFKLSFGTFVAFFGELLLSGYAAIARYCENVWQVHPNVRWFILIPIAGGVIQTFGGACIARSIMPRAMGRWAYWSTLLLVAAVMVSSRIFR